MSYDDGSIQSATNDLYDEHRTIDALLRRLTHSSRRTELVELLQTLHSALREHFAHEEHPGGLYARLGALGPDDQAAVRKLVDDHFRMLAAVRGMTVRVRHDDEPLAVFQGEVLELVRWLEDHESREHRLPGRRAIHP